MTLPGCSPGLLSIFSIESVIVIAVAIAGLAFAVRQPMEKWQTLSKVSSWNFGPSVEFIRVSCSRTETCPMNHLTKIALSLALLSFVAPAANAAPGDTYKMKKAECQNRAKSMDFGIHFVKKNRWVNDCIAGRHPA